MSKRNIYNSILINYLRFILFLSYLFSQSIFCQECSGGSYSADPTISSELNNNNDDCRFSVVKKEWYKCINKIGYGDEKAYFAITKNDECFFVRDCGLIEGQVMGVYQTKECIESCAKIHDSLKGNFIQYGDFCIYSVNQGNDVTEIIGSDPSNYDLIQNNGYKILKCNKAEYKDTSTYFGMTYTKCLKGTSCPGNYYDYETHECVSECSGKKKIKRTETEPIKYQCVSECNNNTAFYYTKTDDDECYDQCPDNTYYYNGTQRPIECIDSCDNDFIVVENHGQNSNICNKSCDIGKIYNNTDNKLYCTKGSCPSGYTLTYSNACLNNCKQTIDLFKIETFQKQSSNECIDNCYHFDRSYKSKINDEYKCDECNGENKFIYNLECVSSCPPEANYYYVNETNANKKECVSKCPNGYYLQGTICHKGSCPPNSDNEIYANDSNVCVACNSESQGYHIYSDQNTLKRCYSKCPADYLFHNINDNTCYSIKKTDGTILPNCLERSNEPLVPPSPDIVINKYFKIDDPYTCYPSCNDAGDYKYEVEEYHCSKEFNCPNYYYSIGNVKKCIEEDHLETCKNLDYMYLRGRECVPQCYDNEYVALPVEGNIFIGLLSLGRCCPQKENCGNFKYYCKCEKNLLRNDCPYKRIKNTDETNIISSTEGNCVMECPPEYPYENKEGTICDDTNNNQYYYKVSDNKFKIVDNCKDINKYHIENRYECISLNDCKIDGKFLYYDDDNICYSSCLGLTNNKYYFDSETYEAPQKCMLECPQGFFYLDGEYKCLDECNYNDGLFYESLTSNKCVEKCGDYEYVYKTNYCINECPSSLFIQTKEITLSINSKHLTINECVDSCEPGSTLLEEGDRKCLRECNSEGKKYKYQSTCVEKCPEGFYIEGNDCKSRCDTQQYYKKNTDDNNYQCIQVCDDYIYNQECIEKCPIGANFIGQKKECKPACTQNDGIYYEKKEEATHEGMNYIIYSCLKNITNISEGNYIVDGTTQIVDECPTEYPYLSIGERKCYKVCSKSMFYPFTAEYNDGTKICATECKEDKKYYGQDKICKSQCDNYTNYIINDEDNSCVSHCDLTSPYKFKTYRDGRYHCALQCGEDDPKYTTPDYTCYERCPAPYNYEWNNECLLKCPDNLFSNFIESTVIDNTGDNEDKYNCADKCQTRPFYYRTDLKCIAQCNSGDYVIEGTNECTPFCGNISSINYHYYISIDETKRQCVLNCPEEKPHLREDNQCYESCNTNSYNYYAEDKVCRSSCPKEYKTIIEGDDQNLFECVKNCDSNHYEDINKYCIESCTNSYSGNQYYNPTEKICLPSCNKTLYYTEGYECVSSCSEGKFIDDKTCRDICPDEKRYFVPIYTHGEVNVQPNICLHKCPENYTFIKIETKDSQQFYNCIGSCDFYINRTDSSECVESCTDSNKFYELDIYGRKSCLSKCPDDAPYYISKDDGDNDINENILCLKNCPENTYKEVNSNECVKLEKCSSEAVDYENKKCVYGCKSTQYWSTKLSKKICLNKCIKEFGSFLYGHQCVENCNIENSGLVANFIDKTCICKNLYTTNENGDITCLDPSETKCSGDYKYRVANTNECVKNCFGVLSTNSDLCYSSYNNCSQIPNTYIVSEDGNLRCDCQYNYYYIQDSDLGKKRKICLGEKDECPTPYLLLNVSNKECVTDCGEYFSLDYKCFKECPEKTQPKPDKKLCIYSSNWYIDENNGNIFLPEGAPCTPQYPYLIDETKQCVNNCSSTKYSYIYKDVCYSSCTIISQKTELPFSRVKPREFSKYYQIASYECQCDNHWYKDNKEEIICTTDDKCPPEYKYTVKETKECVKSCPNDYSFNFNFECFESCEVAKNSYQYPVKEVENLKECSCENLWKKEKDSDDNDLVVCLTDVNCGENELLIAETHECINTDVCPQEDPLKFNNVCYRNDKCPTNTKPNINGNECICVNLWYIQEDTQEKYCLEDTISDCPYETHPYQIYSTKECTTKECKELDPPLRSFNGSCYSECPSSTIEEESDKCICDKQLGYWLIEEGRDKRQIITCGKEKCPDGTYTNNRTHECLPKKCGEYTLYEYKGFCYEGQCPNPTVSENDETNPFVCTVKKYSTATNVNETYNYLKEEIIELYGAIRDRDSGIIYNNFNSTMQLYGIKKNAQKSKDTVVRSGLSHIDLGGCSKKVFINNNMLDGDDIVVLKFDLENQRQRSLINPVEYEFVNSRTGQKLDMSVCTKNDVVISYSLFDILNNYRKENGRKLEEIGNDNELDDILSKIQKQYEKAKLIKSEYDMDSFNINSSLYEDICMTFQVEGKDLVLEDRVGYLYPEYSLCEENCTYSHIDFDLERIYCNCPLKNEFDLLREHKFVLNLDNSDEIISRQKGPTNFAVMKCMSRLKEEKSITENIGFFFTIIIILIQIILLFITIFYNYKNLKAKINRNSTINDDDEIDKEFNVEVIDVENKKNSSNKRINNIKNDVNIKTSERPLNSPPPKKRDIQMDKVIPVNMKLKNKVLDEKEKEKEKEKSYNDGNETINDLSDNNEDDYSDDSISKDYFSGILDSVKSEQKLLRIKFESAIQTNQSSLFIMILTEVFDKIYLIKTICLLSKYDMFSIYFSLYLLYHLLLLSFVTCFYDIKTIHNIYIKDNYPTLSHDLGYGLLSCLIVWVIYKIFLCILNNDEIIKRYIKKRINSSNDSENNVRKNNKKFNNLLCSIKTGMIVYFVIQFIFAVVCLLYVTVFCAVYEGTKKKVFKTYGIALLEVLIIKIIYGIILGILRKVGLRKQSRIIYKIVYYLDKLLH